MNCKKNLQSSLYSTSFSFNILIKYSRYLDLFGGIHGNRVYIHLHSEFSISPPFTAIALNEWQEYSFKYSIYCLNIKKNIFCDSWISFPKQIAPGEL